MNRHIKNFLRPMLKHGVSYILVGAWNTFFGVGLYTALLIVFGQKHYLLLGVICHMISVTNAFLCYKFFVFKTKGNFVREYFKCLSVYSGNMLWGTIEMYICVSLLGLNAVYVNIALTAINFVLSYLGHRYFSFSHRS
jgi:putative flippase GtrA